MGPLKEPTTSKEPGAPAKTQVAQSKQQTGPLALAKKRMRWLSDPPAPKKNIDLVITDLDDTIWDWFTMWHNSFSPYITSIAQRCNIELDKLKADFRKLHQKYHTSECSYIYHELSTLRDLHYEKIAPKEEGVNNIGILHQYYRNKKANLQLYKGVYDALLTLKTKGVKIVGFTESQIFYTKYRLKHLGLDGLFDVIYTIEDHALPDTVIKRYDESFWEPAETEIRTLPRSIRKPNSQVLKKIIEQEKGSTNNSIYIGDKLDRDVYMAQKAGVYSVYAKYGHQITGEQYNLLRSVSHWSDEDIKREIDFKATFHVSSVKPDLILETSFDEILHKFDFTSFTAFSDSNKQSALDIWKKTVEVQQHFNEIELRIRNLALTAFTFILTAMGFLFKEGSVINIFSLLVPSASLVGLIGCCIMFLFFFMDKGWYHRLLLGSVYQAMAIEDRWQSVLPEIRLSNAVKSVSAIKFLGVELRSSDKISWFYKGMMIVLITFAVILFAHSPDNPNLNAEYKEFSQREAHDLRSSLPAPNSPGVLLLQSGDSIIAVESPSSLRSRIRVLQEIHRLDTLMKIKYMPVDMGRLELQEYIRARVPN